MTQDEKRHSANFLGLVYSLYQSAMIQMGKLANPTTGEVQRDIEAARASIDLLDTLSYRTRGNLAEDEDRMIKNMLTELRLNFVDEVEKDQKEREEKEPVGEEPHPDEDERASEGEE
ncbi:DUF1844 domain-containing protein [bacterium]|nr:DUF1844 domain-containing protein [bacterium]